MPRPGFVLDVDRSTPPILFHHGEGFRLERLPAGRSRVIYPAEPIEPLKNPDAAIRHALVNPIGDSEPLTALLKPGMKLTIAFDDISLPLPWAIVSTTHSHLRACSSTTMPRIPTTSCSAAPPRRVRRSRSTSGPRRATSSSTSTSISSPRTGAGNPPPPVSPATDRFGIITTCARCVTRSPSWTAMPPSSIRRTGEWARCSRTPGSRCSRSRPP